MTTPIIRNGFDFTQRFNNGLKGIKEVANRVVDAFYSGVPGLLGTIGYSLSFGRLESLKDYAKKIECVPSISSAVFETALSVINPSARFVEAVRVTKKEPEEGEESFLCSLVNPRFEPIIESLIEKSTLVLRLSTAFGVLVLEAALIIDYSLGLVAATFACLSAGSFPKLNQFAKCALENDAKIFNAFCMGLLLVTTPENFKEASEVDEETAAV